MNVKDISKAGKEVYNVLGILMDMNIDGTDIFYLVQCSYFTILLS